MRILADKSTTIQQTRSASSISHRPNVEQSREPNSVSDLQQTIGNQAVQRLLQRKAAISQPGDASEQVADHVAEQVMRMPETPQGLQMKRVGAGDAGQIDVPPMVNDALRSPGQPLDREVSAFMEPRFGYDFSNVRVHSGATAEQSARDLQASAYTVGSDIVFASGQYAPDSAAGRELIAHELTHVVQQSNNHAQVARRPAPGHADSVEFRVGIEISATLANAAKRIAAAGVTKDALKGLRSVALSDETIDHEERGFLAGLLDPANASKVAGGGTSFVFTKASIDAHLAEVADLDRPQMDEAVITAFKEKFKSVAAGEPDEVVKHVREEEDAALVQMTRLVGRSREGKLRSVVAYATAHGVQTTFLLTAMLAGASDHTAGDMLMAATVYAVAAAVNHQLQHELLGGTIKVDQVPKAQLKEADASYSSEGIGKDKGDTIYVPESLSIDNTADRSQIIHELEHAVQDRGATSGLIRVEVELDAYRAQARYLLDQIAPLKGDPRDTAIKQTAKIANRILIRALILESRTNRSTFEMVIVDINSAMPANVRLNTGELVRFIAMNDVTLAQEAKDAILLIHRIGAGDIGPARGFRGEHDTSRM